MFRSLITIFVMAIIVVIGSYLTYFYISRNKLINFYEDAKKLINEMISMKTSFSPPSYREIYIKIPSDCKIIVDNSSDIISFGCGRNLTRVPMNSFKIDILLFKRGSGCPIENGTLKNGEYKIILAYVPSTPPNPKSCVVYFK